MATSPTEKQSLRLLRTAIDKGFFNKLSGSRAWNEFQHLLDERGECALLCLQRLRQLHLPEHVFPPWKSLYPTDQDLKYAFFTTHTHTHDVVIEGGKFT